MPEKTRKYSDISTEEKLMTVARWLADKKAGDLLALDLKSQNALAEGFVLATATSQRHAQGLADHVLENCKAERFEFLRIEGYQAGSWILLDCNDVLINIMQSEARTLYRLEELWPGARKVIDERAAQAAI